ncbi:MAG: hypothetical protein HF967_05575 [Methanosarcinales archaeon]|nr:hypothetical protein [Methanosarcinales archaeon]
MTYTNFVELKSENTKNRIVGNYSIISYEKSKNDIQKESKSNLDTIYTYCKEEFAWGLSKRVNEVHRSYSMYEI